MAFQPENVVRYIELAQKYGLDVSDENDVRDFILAVRYNDHVTQSDKRLTMAQASEDLGVHPAHISRIKSGRKIIWQVALNIVMAEFLDDETRRDRRHKMFSDLTDLYPEALRHSLEIASGQIRNDAGEVLEERMQPHYRERVAAFREISGSRIAQLWMETQFLGDTQSPEEADHLNAKVTLAQKAAIRLDSPKDVEPIEGETVQPDQTTQDSPQAIQLQTESGSTPSAT